ncbi:MAG: SpoIIE family protein phosphatase, partial [Desulfobacterales bacterium]
RLLMKRNDHLYFKSERSIAGHSASLIIDPDGDSKEWATTQGAVLGFMEDLPYKEETVDLEVGQKFSVDDIVRFFYRRFSPKRFTAEFIPWMFRRLLPRFWE